MFKGNNNLYFGQRSCNRKYFINNFCPIKCIINPSKGNSRGKHYGKAVWVNWHESNG